MGYNRELQPKPESNVSNVYRYLIKASVRNSKAEEFQIIVERRVETETVDRKLNYTDDFYDLLNIERKEK